MTDTAQPPQYAQGFEEHVAYMVQTALNVHGEWATQSHLAWLHRMYCKMLVRTLELDRREQDIARREAAMAAAAFQHAPKKSRRSRNTAAHAACAPSDGALHDTPTTPVP